MAVIGGTEIIASFRMGSSGGVSSLNGETGAITIAAGANTTVTNTSETITIASFGTIAGSIAATQVAFGSGANTITGSNNFEFASGKLLVQDTASGLTPVGTVTIAGAGSGTSYSGDPALLEIISNNDNMYAEVFANAHATGNSGTTRQTFLTVNANSSVAADANAISLSYFQSNVAQSMINFGVGSGPFPANVDNALNFLQNGAVELLIDNADTSVTSVTLNPNAGVQIFTDASAPFELAQTVGGGSAPPLQWDGATSGSAQIGVAAVAGTPNRMNLPLTTGAAGSFLQTNGANPQQLSWVTLTSTTLVASGNATLSVTAIPANTAQTVVTVAATGVLATDSIEWAFNAIPGVGYNQGLYVLVYPSAGNVNFLVVNGTANAYTPGAAVLNWRVIR